MEETRLNKYLSDIGFCSRREADKYIEAGKITIDGKVATLGMKLTNKAKVCFEGKEIKKEQQKVLIAFYKPKGIVCTTSKKEPNNIIDYLHYEKRIYPIGRLDKDSEGLILLTNQGEISDQILRGKNYHEKEYIVKVDKPITTAFLKQMEKGMPILNTITRPCKIKRKGKNCFQIILTQGLNRQIRRMCEQLGYQVVFLKRIRIINILLGELKAGQYREITKEEWEELDYILKENRSV